MDAQSLPFGKAADFRHGLLLLHWEDFDTSLVYYCAATSLRIAVISITV